MTILPFLLLKTILYCTKSAEFINICFQIPKHSCHFQLKFDLPFYCIIELDIEMSDLSKQVESLVSQVKNLSDRQENLHRTVANHKEEADTKFLTLERANVVG